MKDSQRLASLVASGQASGADMDALGAEAVLQIKSNAALLQVRGRGSDIIAQNDKSRQISYLVSDETPDRVGDIIKVSGWDLSQYKSNPVILWAHDGSSVPPIGKASNVRRRYNGSPRLTADVEFAPKEAYEFADTIYQLASRGFIKATSVGFLPKETMVVDEKQRAKMKLGKYGQVFSKAELMEISVVSVPANPAALELGMKQLMKEGSIEKSMAAKFFSSYPKDEEAALARAKAVCRSFVDFGALSSASETKDTPENSYNEEDPVEVAIPEALEAEAEQESPALHQEDKAQEECVERKVPELAEGGTDIADSVAATNKKNLDSEKAFVDAMASLVKQQAEQTKATRQLVDALSDLTNTIHKDLHDGVLRGDSVKESEAATPDVEEKEVVDVEGIIEGRLRGFADGLRRDLNLSSNTTKQQ